MKLENFAMLGLAFALLSSAFGQNLSEDGNEQVCLSVPRGPPGPQGERGPPGDIIQCACNYTGLEDIIHSQQGLVACTCIYSVVVFNN